MTTTQTHDPNRVDPSVKELVTSAAHDVSTMLSAQVELAKAEVSASAKQAGSAFGLIAAAAALAGVAGLFLLVTIAYVLVAVGLPVWAGFGIVTLTLIIIALIVGLIGVRHAKKVRGPVETKKQIELTKEAFSDSPTSPASASQQ
jgi:hypothetical protein